ncbi:MAG: ABC transporter permease [Crocinitomicaceae bacterium]|nr:ABC transporter permease [Crocinitomicaceae bacterium]
MMKLIQIEWMKLKRLNTMKVILIIYAIAVPLIYLSLSMIQVGPLSFPSSTFEFPMAYQMTAWVSSFFNLMIGVIVIVFTTNELKYKTQRQNVIDGLSKREVILSKFYVVVLLSLAVSIYVFVVGFIIGAVNSDLSTMFDGIHHIGAYFISTLGYFIFAFFFANLVRLPALAIVLYLFSTFIEGIIGLIAVQKYAQFFPLSTFSDLVPFPMQFIPEEVPDPHIWEQGARSGLAVCYILIFVIISYVVIRRRDV